MGSSTMSKRNIAVLAAVAMALLFFIVGILATGGEEKASSPNKKSVAKFAAPASDGEKRPAEAPLPPTLADGKALYLARCSGCHGEDGRRSAMNRARPIAGWSPARISATLNGYYMGEIGGDLKGVMRAQVKDLPVEQYETIGLYVSNLQANPN